MSGVFPFRPISRRIMVMLANIVLIFSIAVLFLLGLVVLLNNSKSTANRILTAFIGSSIFWVFTNLMANMATTDEAALFWSRLALPAAAVLVHLFMVYTYYFPKRRQYRKFVLRLFGAPIFFFAALTFTDFNASSITAGQNNLEVGWLYYLFIAYFVLSGIVGFSNLIKSYRESKGKERMQVAYMLAGLLLAFIPGLITNAFAIIFENYFFVTIGPSVSLIMVGFWVLAIVRHRLFNIRLVVARSLAYILLLATLASTYGILLFGVSSVFFRGSEIPTIQNLVYIALAVILAFTFQPLKTFFEKFTDKIFFRDHYDSQHLINEVGQILVEEFKLERMIQKSLAKIGGTIRVAAGNIYVFEKDKIYQVSRYGSVPHKLMTDKDLFFFHRKLTILDEIEHGKEKEIMEDHNIRLVLRLSTREEFVGYLALGDKLSGDIYSSQDIEALEILGQELAVAISNSKAYEEIANFNMTLQDKVDDATKRLRVANNNLKELDKAKDEFISMASHQLRTPLTTIKGYLSMLSEGDAGKLTKQQKEFIDYSYSGSQRMVNLISDLLNVSRMSAGKFMIEKAPIDLAEVVDQEVFQLQSHAKAKNLDLIYKKPAKLGLIELDENKTRQVIMNFIDNAIYYTKEGSVTVTLNKVGDNLELRVKDTGIGVPVEAQKKLFSKFFRADNAQTVRPDGTGLGLYLAKRVVEDQGGKIIFETTEGKGSIFGFSMPAKNIVSPQEIKQKDPSTAGI